MPFTILQPAPAAGYNPYQTSYAPDSDSDSESGGIDLEGDVSMSMGRPAKRLRPSEEDSIVTPGEIITEDAQWMR
jgi:exosome complex component RRP4